MPWDPPFAHRAPTGGVSGVNRVRFMGLFDQQDRLMVVATHNTDIADGWEREGESREFFERVLDRFLRDHHQYPRVRVDSLSSAHGTAHH